MIRPDKPSWTAAKAQGDAGERNAAATWEAMGFAAYLRPGQHAHDLLAQATIEVKRDAMAASSGNFALEVSYRGRSSGIMATDASLWHIDAGGEVFIVPTDRLRALANSGRFRRTRGGDDQASELVLIPLADLRRSALLVIHGESAQ